MKTETASLYHRLVVSQVVASYMKDESIPSTKPIPKQPEKSNSPSSASSKPKTNQEPLQGTKVILPDVEPWPEPVNLAEVLSGIAETICSYAVLPEGAADALALWCAHTHVFQRFQITPRLVICSPEKGCGKTTLRDVLALFVSRPLPTENMTPAVLFRLVAAHSPTVMADEYDAWLTEKEELRGLINAGHKKGGGVLRCIGDNNEVRKFECFAPVVLSGIGSVPATIHDRSIVIRLVRAKPGELSKRFDSRHAEPEKELCRKLARWCRDNGSRLERCDPALPSGVINRLADNWRPLFAIAEIAGEDWSSRVANSFAKLNERNDEDAQGIGGDLLSDIRIAFRDEKVKRLGSYELCVKLANLEGRPWAEYGRSKESISQHELAKILKPFGIHTRNTKMEGGKVCKAYHLEDFHDTFSRYLAPEGESSRYPATMPENIGDSEVLHPLPLDPKPLPSTSVALPADSGSGQIP